MKRCPNCGAMLEDSYQFCNVCGKAVPNSAATAYVDPRAYQIPQQQPPVNPNAYQIPPQPGSQPPQHPATKTISISVPAIKLPDPIRWHTALVKYGLLLIGGTAVYDGFVSLFRSEAFFHFAGMASSLGVKGMVLFPMFQIIHLLLCFAIGVLAWMARGALNEEKRNAPMLAKITGIAATAVPLMQFVMVMVFRGVLNQALKTNYQFASLSAAFGSFRSASVAMFLPFPILTLLLLLTNAAALFLTWKTYSALSSGFTK